MRNNYSQVINMTPNFSKGGDKVEYSYQGLKTQKWVRSQEGWFAGVCQGLGESFGIDPWLLRAVWLVSFFFFGAGLFFYIGLAFTLPKQGEEGLEANQSKLLGVCQRIHKKTGMDIGLTRFLCLFLGISSFGATMVGYIILHFVLSEEQ